MKSHWKRVMVAATAVIMSWMIGGCGVSSNFNEPNPQAGTVDSAVMEQIDLNALSHGEEGYYYKDLKWGLREEEIEAVVGYDLGKAEVMGNGEIIRYNPTIHYKLGEKIPTSVDFICESDGRLRQVIFQFEKRTSDDNLEELYAQLMEQLTAIYGPQTDKKEDSQQIGNTTMKTVTDRWDKTLSDGRMTSMQIATASTAETYDVYDVLVFGVTCYSPEELSSESEE